jgi:hypothetical protein
MAKEEMLRTKSLQKTSKTPTGRRFLQKHATRATSYADALRNNRQQQQVLSGQTAQPNSASVGQLKAQPTAWKLHTEATALNSIQQQKETKDRGTKPSTSQSVQVTKTNISTLNDMFRVAAVVQ